VLQSGKPALCFPFKQGCIQACKPADFAWCSLSASKHIQKWAALQHLMPHRYKMRSKLFCSCFCAKKGTPGAVLGTSTITCQSVAGFGHLVALNGIMGLQSMHIAGLKGRCRGAERIRSLCPRTRGLRAVLAYHQSAPSCTDTKSTCSQGSAQYCHACRPLPENMGQIPL